MFFSFFPTILYDNEFIQDLSKRIAVQDVGDPRFMYDPYYVQNGERPDSISNKFYDVPYYHWVILVTNGLTLKTWPKSDAALGKFIEWNYGGVNNSVDHYETDEGLIVPNRFPAKFVDQDGVTQEYYFNGDGLGGVQDNVVYNLGKPVLTYDKIVEENDKRKNIRILDKRYLPEITELAQRLLSSR